MGHRFGHTRVSRRAKDRWPKPPVDRTLQPINRAFGSLMKRRRRERERSRGEVRRRVRSEREKSRSGEGEARKREGESSLATVPESRPTTHPYASFSPHQTPVSGALFLPCSGHAGPELAAARLCELRSRFFPLWLPFC